MRCKRSPCREVELRNNLRDGILGVAVFAGFPTEALAVGRGGDGVDGGVGSGESGGHGRRGGGGPVGGDGGSPSGRERTEA